MPTRLADWPLASSNASFGRKPAVLRKNAINRVAIEPTFLRHEKKIGTRIAWPLFQQGPQGRDFVHARTSPHSKQRLSSFQGSLESLNCDFHIAPIDVAQLESNQFAFQLSFNASLKVDFQSAPVRWSELELESELDRTRAANLIERAETP